MKKETLNRLMQKISGLTDDQKLRFGIAVCERMYAGYEDFALKHGFGNPHFLKNTLEQLKKGITKTEIAFFIDNIDAVLPDMDDFSGLLSATAALDAGAAIYELVTWLQNRDSKHLQTVLSLSLNANEMYVSDFTAEPFTHPLLLAEIVLLEKWLEQTVQNNAIEQPSKHWAAKFRAVDAG